MRPQWIRVLILGTRGLARLKGGTKSRGRGIPRQITRIAWRLWQTIWWLGLTKVSILSNPDSWGHRYSCWVRLLRLFPAYPIWVTIRFVVPLSFFGLTQMLRLLFLRSQCVLGATTSAQLYLRFYKVFFISIMLWFVQCTYYFPGVVWIKHWFINSDIRWLSYSFGTYVLPETFYWHIIFTIKIYVYDIGFYVYYNCR